MKNKLVSMEEAVSHVKDGMTVFIGGFLGVGTPEKIIDALIAKGVKDLTVIANDTGFPDKGIGRLVVNNQVKKVIASHIGTNPETGRKMQSGEMEVELAPQGTLAERVRAGGNGLGGILTPTGIGTIVEEGKEVLTVDGKKYILEKPLRADVALLNGSVVDVQEGSNQSLPAPLSPAPGPSGLPWLPSGTYPQPLQSFFRQFPFCCGSTGRWSPLSVQGHYSSLSAPAHTSRFL